MLGRSRAASSSKISGSGCCAHKDSDAFTQELKASEEEIAEVGNPEDKAAFNELSMMYADELFEGVGTAGNPICEK